MQLLPVTKLLHRVAMKLPKSKFQVNGENHYWTGHSRNFEGRQESFIYWLDKESCTQTLVLILEKRSVPKESFPFKEMVILVPKLCENIKLNRNYISPSKETPAHQCKTFLLLFFHLDVS